MWSRVRLDDSKPSCVRCVTQGLFHKCSSVTVTVTWTLSFHHKAVKIQSLDLVVFVVVS